MGRKIGVNPETGEMVDVDGASVRGDDLIYDYDLQRWVTLEEAVARDRLIAEATKAQEARRKIEATWRTDTSPEDADA